MFFDLSQGISLDKKNLALYGKLRVLLYALSFLLAGYLAFNILFPSLFFQFSFLNPKAKTNTIIDPRSEDLSPIEKGSLPAGKDFLFNASFTGTYSTAVISFSLNDKSAALSSQGLSVKRSYSAFLYPEGETMGFRDGSLLRADDAFFIVSQGKLRKFSDLATLDSLGFSRDSFLTVSEDELKYDPEGEAIGGNSGYPDYSLFHIQNDFYQLQGQRLKKFVSDSAFLTYYRPSQAIEKSPDFLKQFEADENPIGFAEGSLLSYADSIFVVENGKIFPIDNPLTFIGKGFDWNDVRRSSADEIALYEKGKLFTIANDHPEGTIFTAVEDHRRYLIQNGQRHLLPSENIFASWKNTAPISVSENSLQVTSHCQLEKSLLQRNVFQCEMPITDLQNLIGSDYVFSMRPDKDARLDSIDIEFKKDVSPANFRLTLSEILSRIKNNYAR